MELKLSASYDATPEEVFAIVTDATFREQACQKTKALSYDVEVTESGGDTIVRVQPRDAVGRRTGYRPQVRRPDADRGPDRDLAPGRSRTGRGEADVARRDHQHPGQPEGQREHHAPGRARVQAIDLDVKVAVPLIGKKIEPFVVDAIRSGLQKEHELGRDWTN